MRVSDVVKVNSEFRRHRKAQSLAETISRRLAWVRKNMPERATPAVALKAEKAIKTLVGEINTYLSRDTLLNQPVRQTLNEIFTDIPEPKKANQTELEHAITELMNMRGKEIAAKQHRFAVMCAIAHAAYNNNYMIFNTLTVRPGEYYAVFSKESTAFKNYIRKIDRETATATSGSVRRGNDNYTHQHFACVEEGGQNGRLHIHSLHILNVLPRISRDPNAGRLRPTERELHCLRSAWAYGHSKPLMVRYSPNDAYGRANYRWPIDPKTNDAMQIRSPLALANYLSKYINKGYTSCQRSKLLWRVRKSQRLGHEILHEMLEPLSTSTLLILTTADNLKLKLNNQQIPQNLIRLISLKIIQNRLSTKNHNGFKSIAEIAMQLTPRLSPLHYSRASIQTIHENNQQNMRYLSMVDCATEATFNNAWEEIYAQRKTVDEKYFPRNNGIYGKTSTRDHIYNRQNANSTQIN